MKIKIVEQAELTSECWMIQIWGLRLVKSVNLKIQKNVEEKK